METKTKLRKWGSSLGVVIPKEIIKKQHLKQGEEIIIEIKRKPSIKKMFGSLKGWKLDAQKFKDEIRKEELRK